MKRTSRKPSKLSSSLQGHLNAYALAASAAGVGMLVLARPAEAKIIYTPAHHHVLLNNWLGLDLNHDGIVDFAIRRTTYYDLDRANATWVYVKGARPESGCGDRADVRYYLRDLLLRNCICTAYRKKD